MFSKIIQLKNCAHNVSVLLKVLLVAPMAASSWDKTSHQDSFWSKIKKRCKLWNHKTFIFRTEMLKTNTSSNQTSNSKPVYPIRAVPMVTGMPCLCNQSNRKTASQDTNSLPCHKCKAPRKWMCHKRCINREPANTNLFITKINIRRWLCWTQVSILFHKKTALTCHTRLLCRARATSNSRSRWMFFQILNIKTNIKIRIWFII